MNAEKLKNLNERENELEFKIISNKKSDFECKKFNKTEQVMFQRVFQHETVKPDDGVQELFKLESNFFRSADRNSIGVLYDKFFSLRNRQRESDTTGVRMKCCGHSPHFKMVDMDETCLDQ